MKDLCLTKSLMLSKLRSVPGLFQPRNLCRKVISLGSAHLLGMFGCGLSRRKASFAIIEVRRFAIEANGRAEANEVFWFGALELISGNPPLLRHPRD